MTVPRTAAVIIASTRAAAGVYPDECGPLIQRWLVENGFLPQETRVVPDGDPVGQALRDALGDSPSVVITSGGTGLSPDDLTPEQTAPHLERHLPGIMEAVRRLGAEKVPTAALSRGHAGTVGRTFVINLPGSPGGVKDGLTVLEPLLGHLCSQLEGKNEH